MKGLTAVVLSALGGLVAGCPGVVEPQAAAPLPPPAPVFVEVPVFVPIPVPVDTTRGVCWYMSEAEAADSLLAIDDGWWRGDSLQYQYDLNTLACSAQPTVSFSVCVNCWDTMVEFIYFVWH